LTRLTGHAIAVMASAKEAEDCAIKTGFTGNPLQYLRVEY